MAHVFSQSETVVTYTQPYCYQYKRSRAFFCCCFKPRSVRWDGVWSQSLAEVLTENFYFHFWFDSWFMIRHFVLIQNFILNIYRKLRRMNLNSTSLNRSLKMNQKETSKALRPKSFSIRRSSKRFEVRTWSYTIQTSSRISTLKTLRERSVRCTSP